ncbi:relaxase/mobilization nuclease domain-containing protein [Robinsoniella sp. KNHs210]|uniref:relaxase/mobilization nuclease domain-containing protein n=1 Tax=Robinsoniella sp. KNHs210 TaxID=1469950 RepID=UPI000482E43A|nr:relaxase/mobilization nuclease domain-containing protein [Robinsoniella sp. KNHs210]
MAIFKFINKKYQTTTDLYNLINYVIENASSYYSPNMFHSSPDIMCAQFQYYKNYYYKIDGNQAIHFCLSIDSKKWEKDVTLQNFYKCGLDICNIFRDYQTIMALHTDKKSHWDIHFVCNSVSFITGLKYHSSPTDFNYIMQEVAIYLSRYHMALQTINYYDENNKLRRGSETSSFLYQNKDYF